MRSWIYYYLLYITLYFYTYLLGTYSIWWFHHNVVMLNTLNAILTKLYKVSHCHCTSSEEATTCVPGGMCELLHVWSHYNLLWLSSSIINYLSSLRFPLQYLFPVGHVSNSAVIGNQHPEAHSTLQYSIVLYYVLYKVVKYWMDDKLEPTYINKHERFHLLDDSVALFQDDYLGS